MGERSGHANSVRRRMCGRGGVAGAAIMTSQRVCAGKYRQAIAARLENGPRALRLRAGRKTESPKIWRQKNMELRARIEALEKKGVEGAQGGQGLPSRRRSGMGKSGEWTWTWR